MSFAQPCDLGYELNGTDDYIQIPNTTNINSNNTAVANRTIETWFKTTDATTKQVIYEEGGGGNAILIYLDADQLYSGAYRNNGSSAEFFRSASGDILDDTWYHVAFVISTSGGTTTFLWYLDGVLQDSQTGFTVPKHTGDINLGRNARLRYPNCGTWSASSVTGSNSEHCTNTVTAANNTKYYFAGNIWGFRVWNSGRTSTEINDNIDSELTSGTNLVAYLADDDIEYLNSSNVWTTASANGNGTTYTWSSTASTTDWNTSGNWNGNNIPSTTKLQKVVIPSSTNYPSISSEIRIGKLDLSSSSSEITVEDGGTLNVYYDISNSGTITIENNGSFILQDNEAVSGTGSYVMDRDTPDYPIDDFFSIWSTPMAEADSEIGTIFTNDIVTFKYDASQNPSAYVGVAKTENMEVGRGYFIKSDDDNGVLTRTFTGTVNNGNVDETIYFNSSTDNFNLIGNPYPSAIDWLTFQADNSSVLNGTMYFWSQTVTGANNSASDYISFNSTGSNIPGTTGDIASGQGIFTKSSQAGTATFKNTHRVVGNNAQFFRSSNNPDDGKSWFKLAGDNGFSSILIGFIPGATDGYESEYDGEFVNEGSAIEFYSFIGVNKYAIQGKSELEESMDEEVPLGLEVTTAGTYTFSIFQEFISADFDIILDDTQENVQTNLRLSDYTFTLASPAEVNNRFILRYNYNQTLEVDELIVDSKNIRTYFEGNNLITIVSESSLPNQIDIFDTTGKKIVSSVFSDRMKIDALSSGLYLVKYKFDNTTSMTKKVLKR